MLNVTDSGQEALAIYEDLDLKSLQLEALEALAAACKAGEKRSWGEAVLNPFGGLKCVLFSTILGMLIPTD